MSVTGQVIFFFKKQFGYLTRNGNQA